MILQALKEYYDRKPDLPRFGFEFKEIPYIIILKTNGTLLNIMETYEGIGKERRPKQFLVPQTIKRSIGISANLLWDNPEYALGISCKGKPDRVANQHAAFIKRLDDIHLPKEPALNALRTFLANPNKEKELECFGLIWEELKKSGANVSFQIAGKNCLIVEQNEIKLAIEASILAKGDALCLITGEKDVPERLHAAIKGVWGAQSSGANIVSFNLDAFKSFNKRQGDNAPVGKAAAFAYTTALNHMLGKTSKQRIQVGDSSTIFWAQKEDPFEEQMLSFFGEPPKDDPDRNVRAVESLFKSVRTGTVSTKNTEMRFYVLGLAPNASRISVRFWIMDTISGMSGKICEYFEDMKIVHGPKDRDVLSLFRLLVSTAAMGKSENIIPNIAGDFMRSIFEGRPYPQTLLLAAIRRIRAEHDITYPRAALIKACLNRTNLLKHNNQKEELAVSLDVTNTNIGYRLGRLFAALEKIQSEASPGISATIRDRFYGAASSTPITVFGNLMRLKNHHLAKLDKPGRRIYFEKLLIDIMSDISDFPSYLHIEDQGRFAIGYYHQMQGFYTKKSTSDDKEN